LYSKEYNINTQIQIITMKKNDPDFLRMLKVEVKSSNFWKEIKEAFDLKISASTTRKELRLLTGRLSKYLDYPCEYPFMLITRKERFAYDIHGGNSKELKPKLYGLLCGLENQITASIPPFSPPSRETQESWIAEINKTLEQITILTKEYRGRTFSC